MSFEIKKLAVLGTGVMGSEIAAHLSNAKIPVLAFDINQKIASEGIKNSVSIKPSPYFNPKTVETSKKSLLLLFFEGSFFESLTNKNMIITTINVTTDIIKKTFLQPIIWLIIANGLVASNPPNPPIPKIKPA